MRTTGNYSTTSESYMRTCNLPWSCDLLYVLRFMQDHSTSSLIWNYKVANHMHFACMLHACYIPYMYVLLQTREELREALENEIRSFTVDKVISHHMM